MGNTTHKRRVTSTTIMWTLSGVSHVSSNKKKKTFIGACVYVWRERERVSKMCCGSSAGEATKGAEEL